MGVDCSERPLTGTSFSRWTETGSSVGKGLCRVEVTDGLRTRGEGETLLFVRVEVTTDVRNIIAVTSVEEGDSYGRRKGKGCP